MTPARWRQIEELYHSAREREPGARSALLAEACDGDEELRRGVELLLAQGDSGDKILDGPAADRLLDPTVMQIAAGTQLGPYRIEGTLGAGGMGEVFRGLDTRLGRAVAIKFSHERFSGRFEREARAISALNHPNICTLYDIGPNYLVMELVEGETLASPLPVPTALRYARQIAEALEYAHERGVVHRDLKPANVKVTSEGAVKLLDFGLAKAIENPAAPHGDQEDSPTATQGLTGVGEILGTAAYMSPEQARGETADRRADIWSFGAVLYQMLSGQRAFSGKSASDTLASVLKVDPDWNVLPASTPTAIRELVRRCLTKDRKQRLQAIGDARIAIEEVLADAPAQQAPAPASGSRWTVLPWAIAACLMTLVAAGGWLIAWRSSQPVDHPLLRLSVDLGPDAVAGDTITAAISHDGARLAFLTRGADGKQQLATRLLGKTETTLLSGTENPSAPFFSPKGDWIGFFAAGKLKKVSVYGGTVIVVCDASWGRGAAWGEDDQIILTPDANTGIGLFRVPAAGGVPQALTHPGEKGEATHRWPQMLPGGQTVLFTGNKTASNYDDSSIEVLTLKTGEVKVVQRGGYFGRYLPSGYLVYLNGRTLFGVPFDLGRLEVRGTPTPLLDDVAASSQNAGGQFDFSHNGTFVYLSGKDSASEGTVAWLNSAGNTEPLLAVPGTYMNLRFSPDGKRLAFSSNRDIETYDWERGTTTRLTAETQASDLVPVWNPDGKHIVFQSQGNSAWSIQWIRADGAGTSQRLRESKNRLAPYSFSPDGKRLAFYEHNAETNGFDLWTLPLDTSDPEHPRPAKPDLFLHGPFSAVDPVFSPDGRWIAYSSNESGRGEVFVRPFPAGGTSSSDRWQISSAGGKFPIWSRDGRELFYEDPDNRIMVVASTAEHDSFAAGKPRAWSNKQLAGFRDLTPDGKRFVVSLPLADSGEPKGSVHVTFLLNFFDEVRRRIPAGK